MISARRAREADLAKAWFSRGRGGQSIGGSGHIPEPISCRQQTHSSSRRTPGPITTVLVVKVGRATGQPRVHGVWVPACAGTTRRKVGCEAASFPVRGYPRFRGGKHK